MPYPYSFKLLKFSGKFQSSVFVLMQLREGWQEHNNSILVVGNPSVHIICLKFWLLFLFSNIYFLKFPNLYRISVFLFV